MKKLLSVILSVTMLLSMTTAAFADGPASSEYGDGVISANMSFVMNGDKDNIFSRLYEITRTFVEDSIKMAKVK